MTSRRITEREIQLPNGIATQVLSWTEDSAARAASFYMEAEGKNRIRENEIATVPPMYSAVPFRQSYLWLGFRSIGN
jgi:hypothetical protein